MQEAHQTGQSIFDVVRVDEKKEKDDYQKAKDESDKGNQGGVW